MKTFAFARGTSGGRPYFVLVHTAEPPADEAWRAYVEALTEVATKSSSEVRSLVATDGGAPSAPQRRALAGAYAVAREAPFSHIFTDDAFVRGVVTAFRWVARARASAHTPEEFTGVCADCGLAHAQVLYDLILLQKTMPMVRTIRRITDAMQPNSLQTPP